MNDNHTNYLYEKKALKNIFEKIKDFDVFENIDELKNISEEIFKIILKVANDQLYTKEKKYLNRLADNLDNLNGRAFIFDSIDLSFRCKDNKKAAYQIAKIVKYFGTPSSFSIVDKIKLFLFQMMYQKFYFLITPLIKKSIIKNFSHLVILDNKESIFNFLTKEKKLINFAPVYENKLGFLNNYLSYYLDYVKNENMSILSIKPSALIGDIKLNAYESFLHTLENKLSKILDITLTRKNSLLINLEMENYDYFDLTIDTFSSLAQKEKYKNIPLGITLQSYLPQSFEKLKQILDIAKWRKENNFSPIEISLVKGSYYNYEKVLGSIKKWPQAPYTSKIETDANFKKILLHILKKENFPGVKLSICTHNLFDISFALVIANSKDLQKYISFQMVHGRCPHIQKALEILLNIHITQYIGIYKKNNVNEAVAFLHRKLEDYLGLDNFLKHLSKLKIDNNAYNHIKNLFFQSIDQIELISNLNRRRSEKKYLPISQGFYGAFENEPDSDFSLKITRKWQEEIFLKCKNFESISIPSVIDGKEIFSNDIKESFSPNNPKKMIYKCHLANEKDIHIALKTANNEKNTARDIPLDKKKQIISKAAQLIRKNRAQLIQTLLLDIGKPIDNADSEISESIDMIEYYLTRLTKLLNHKDIELSPKGTILIITAKSFASSFPISGIIAALLTGNTVLFKPSSHAALTAWHLVNILWEAGISKKILQFIHVSDDICDNYLLKSNLIDHIVLSAKRSTVESFVKTSPNKDISALSEGNNIMIISSIVDRKLAIKNLIHSAFAFSGQQYSCPSIAIIHKDLYDDLTFMQDLKDATLNLEVGDLYDAKTNIGPLMTSPHGMSIKKTLKLYGDEKWLLKPKPSENNPLLWHPGIKINTSINGFLFNNFSPIPVIGLIRAKSFHHSVSIAKKSKFGLTAGLQSLDHEEHLFWKKYIHAGNLFINNLMTSSIIRRHPFGGTKKSSFGKGLKIGGPNYLLNFVNIEQKNLPKEKRAISNNVNYLTSFMQNFDLSAEDLGTWYSSIANYSFWWNRIKTYRDPAKIIGQDNFYGYIPLKSITLRITKDTAPLDFLRIIAAALTVNANLSISYDKNEFANIDFSKLPPNIIKVEENEDLFIERIKNGNVKRIKISTKPSKKIMDAATEKFVYIDTSKVIANGRIELLNYLREISISNDYHRNGCLGVREEELRKFSL